MIKLLDNKNIKMAEDIAKLQKASYIVEAELINFMQIPPLIETPEAIMEGDEIYYGYYVESALAGLIAYKVEADWLDIYKAAVHPDYFKRGIATQLLKLIEKTEGIKRITVSTGLKNSPAVNLYTSLGYIKVKEFEVLEGVFIVSFEKQVKRI